MAIKQGQYFVNPAEKWNAATCKRAVQHIARDGLGTPYPKRGMFPEFKSGRVRYNGGCQRPDYDKGDWYEGEVFQLPILARGYRWVYEITWCYRIVRSST